MGGSCDIKNTVEKVNESGLCIGCGTCEGICPTNSIQMIINGKGLYEPFITQDTCKKCGMCVAVCPGHKVDFDDLTLRVFGKTPTNASLGCFSSCNLGYSTNQILRSKCSSGGVVTTLLINALNNGIIDGALLTRMKSDDPCSPEVFIARSEAEIVSAAGSKYCPTPVGKLLKSIVGQKGKFAVVGLPCQIRGIRKAECADHRLKEKLVLHIGLFCSHLVDFRGTKFLLGRMNIQQQDIKLINYREQGWPGKIGIHLKDGTVRSMNYTDYWDCFFGGFFFTPIRCTLCPDAANELSDISVGDAWLPEFKKLKSGVAMVISRNATGESLMRLVSSMKKLNLKPIDHIKVEQSLSFNLKVKKKTIGQRFAFMELLGKKTPEIRPKPASPINVSIFITVLPYIAIKLSDSKRFRFLLRYTPFALARLWFRLIYLSYHYM